MPKEQEVHFLVKKETYKFRECEHCRATGRKKRTFQGRKFEEPCPPCKGTGLAKVTHQTEVTLLEALRELNLIK